MITPVKSVSIPFTSDGVSTALIVDLSTLGLGINGFGQTAGVQSPAIAASAGAAVPNPTATIAGSILTVTLAAALPAEYNANLVLYTLSFLLQFNSLPLPS